MCICVFQQSYDILLLILMVLLLVQAVLTSATVVHCASYKSQLRMGSPECDDSMNTHYCEVRQVRQVELWKQGDKSVCPFFLLVCLSPSNKRYL